MLEAVEALVLIAVVDAKTLVAVDVKEIVHRLVKVHVCQDAILHVIQRVQVVLGLVLEAVQELA